MSDNASRYRKGSRLSRQQFEEIVRGFFLGLSPSQISKVNEVSPHRNQENLFYISKELRNDFLFLRDFFLSDEFKSVFTSNSVVMSLNIMLLTDRTEAATRNMLRRCIFDCPVNPPEETSVFVFSRARSRGKAVLESLLQHSRYPRFADGPDQEISDLGTSFKTMEYAENLTHLKTRCPSCPLREFWAPNFVHSNGENSYVNELAELITYMRGYFLYFPRIGSKQFSKLLFPSLIDATLFSYEQEMLDSADAILDGEKVHQRPIPYVAGRALTHSELHSVDLALKTLSRRLEVGEVGNPIHPHAEASLAAQLFLRMYQRRRFENDDLSRARPRRSVGSVQYIEQEFYIHENTIADSIEELSSSNEFSQLESFFGENIKEIILQLILGEGISAIAKGLSAKKKDIVNTVKRLGAELRNDPNFQNSLLLDRYIQSILLKNPAIAELLVSVLCTQYEVSDQKKAFFCLNSCSFEFGDEPLKVLEFFKNFTRSTISPPQAVELNKSEYVKSLSKRGIPLEKFDADEMARLLDTSGVFDAALSTRESCAICPFHVHRDYDDLVSDFERDVQEFFDHFLLDAKMQINDLQKKDGEDINFIAMLAISNIFHCHAQALHTTISTLPGDTGHDVDMRRSKFNEPFIHHLALKILVALLERAKANMLGRKADVEKQTTVYRRMRSLITNSVSAKNNPAEFYQKPFSS